MEILKNKIDSMITGKRCLDLTDFSKDIDFNKFENAYLKREKPFYVLCRIPVEEISNIHAIESCGFHFIEFQIKMTHKIKKKYPSLKQYEFAEVTSEEDLKKVQEIAATTFVDDRFIIDPLIDSELASKRYIQYVSGSFHSDDQKLYKLSDIKTGKIVAFKTHKYTGNNEVLLLLGGVDPKYKSLGVGLINAYAELNELRSKEIKRLTTHISGRNYPIINLEISTLGFKVVQSYLVFRKIYS